MCIVIEKRVASPQVNEISLVMLTIWIQIQAITCTFPLLIGDWVRFLISFLITQQLLLCDIACNILTIVILAIEWTKRDAMKGAFESLGSQTSNKFIQVWEELYKVTNIL